MRLAEPIQSCNPRTTEHSTDSIYPLSPATCCPYMQHAMKATGLRRPYKHSNVQEVDTARYRPWQDSRPQSNDLGRLTTKQSIAYYNKQEEIGDPEQANITPSRRRTERMYIRHRRRLRQLLQEHAVPSGNDLMACQLRSRMPSTASASLNHLAYLSGDP